MKFISIQENINRALNIVNQTNFKNINLPILNNVLIKANQNEVELVSTNLELAVSHKMRAKVEKSGEFTVDLKTLNSFINLLNDENVEIERKENILSVKTNNYKTNINGVSAKDFPLVPLIKSENKLSLKSSILKEAFLSVIFSVSFDSRPELSGVLISVEKDKIVFTATDGFKLAEKSIFYKKNNTQEIKIIVPHKTVQELLRIFSNYKNLEDVEIQILDDQIKFSFNSTEIISRTINSSFPDYKEIIPKETKTKITINREEFIRAIKASSLFSREKSGEIKLHVHEQNLKLSSFSNEVGETEVNLKIKQEGHDQELALNYRYLLEGLNIIKQKEVEILLLDSNAPCIIKGVNEEGFLYLIMTIQS